MALSVASLIEFLIQLSISIFIGVLIVLPFIFFYTLIRNWMHKKRIPKEVQAKVLENDVKLLKMKGGYENEIHEEEGQNKGESEQTNRGSSRNRGEYRDPRYSGEFPKGYFKPLTEYTPGVTGSPTIEDIKRKLANTNVEPIRTNKPMSEGTDRGSKRKLANPHVEPTGTDKPKPKRNWADFS